jgi:hypothetical protein
MARPIPTPDVQFCDPKTGLITQPWFEYFKSRDRGAPGTGGGSNVSAWFYGTGVPSNSLGIDGDFYIQISGTTGEVIAFRVKTNGAWV